MILLLHSSPGLPTNSPFNDILFGDPFGTCKRSSNTFRTHPPHAPIREWLAITIGGTVNIPPRFILKTHGIIHRNLFPRPSTQQLHARIIIRQTTRRHPGNLFHEHIRRIKLIHNTRPSIPNPNTATHRINRDTPKRRNKRNLFAVGAGRVRVICVM